MKNFALTGVAGFVAPRHLTAIRDTRNILLAAVDPHDSVGILDNFFPDARYFREIERFDRYLEKLRHRSEQDRVHYLSVCSPSYLHDAHIRMALRVGAHAICEKPVVINPWNLDQLKEVEAESGCQIFSILQLRLHPSLTELKKQIDLGKQTEKSIVDLTYITRRGSWYQISWKGSNEKSGGLAMNIGVHFFDILLWLFGPVAHSEVHLAEQNKTAGYLELERAHVRWFLSVDYDDLPESARKSGDYAYRSINIDGTEVEFSQGFTDLHTRAYKAVLAGEGFGIEEARPSIDLLYTIRHSDVISFSTANLHPLLKP